MLELCNQWFIYGKVNEEPPANYDENNHEQIYYDPKAKYGKPILGGLNNGYTLKELKDYIYSIEGFSSYLFNRSHSVAYAFLSVCCLYLKTFHMKEFFAAVLSLEEKEEKRDVFCNTIRKYGIGIKPPDINLSDYNFKVVGDDILYGLGKIKGVGDAKLPTILKNRPYTSLKDAYDKNIINKKKYFDKKTGEGLIKAGAFDFLDFNRNALLNEFQDIRKPSKKEERLIEENYDKNICMEYEMEVLGSSITYVSEWNELAPGKTLSTTIYIKSIKEKIDKNNNMMAFIKADIGPNKNIEGIIFAKTYYNCLDIIKENQTFNVKLKKDDNGKKFIISKFIRTKQDYNLQENNLLSVLI